MADRLWIGDGPVPAGFDRLGRSVPLGAADAADSSIPAGDGRLIAVVCEALPTSWSGARAVRFLEECHRVLAPGGICRLIGAEGSSAAELAPLAGFLIRGRQATQRASTRAGIGGASPGDVDLAKADAELEDELPRVSILVPAYHAEFLGEALGSAAAQTYRRVEILVCNDHPGSAVRRVVEESQARLGRIDYVENEENLGSVRTYERCFDLARGTYLKYLNDDDLLEPGAVATMVAYAEAFAPSVRLVTSRRLRIGPAGAVLADISSTTPLFFADAYVHGIDLGDFILRHVDNLVGEPTTGFFRKADLADLEPSIFSLAGTRYPFNVDVILWLNLLAKGDAVYVSRPLSRFRVHGGQESQDPRILLSLLTVWRGVFRDARALGFLQAPGGLAEARASLARLLRMRAADRTNPDDVRRRLAEAADEAAREALQEAADVDLSLGDHHSPGLLRELNALREGERWEPPLRHRYTLRGPEEPPPRLTAWGPPRKTAGPLKRARRSVRGFLKSALRR